MNTADLRYQIVTDDNGDIVKAIHLVEVEYYREEIPLEIIETEIQRVKQQLDKCHSTILYDKLDKYGKQLLKLRDEKYAWSDILDK